MLQNLLANRELLLATSLRPPILNCFGLHEWAMLYVPPTSGADDGRATRHQALGLRVSQQTINDLVESRAPLRCTHFDAFRFYTAEAMPLNAKELTREDQLELEQPGCVHATMDLFKLGESSHRSQHLNGSRLSLSRTEHSFNQCTIGLTRGPFIYSVFRAVNPSSVFLTLS